MKVTKKGLKKLIKVLKEEHKAFQRFSEKNSVKAIEMLEACSELMSGLDMEKLSEEFNAIFNDITPQDVIEWNVSTDEQRSVVTKKAEWKYCKDTDRVEMCIWADAEWFTTGDLALKDKYVIIAEPFPDGHHYGYFIRPVDFKTLGLPQELGGDIFTIVPPSQITFSAPKHRDD